MNLGSSVKWKLWEKSQRSANEVQCEKNQIDFGSRGRRRNEQRKDEGTARVCFLQLAAADVQLLLSSDLISREPSGCECRSCQGTETREIERLRLSCNYVG